MSKDQSNEAVIPSRQRADDSDNKAKEDDHKADENTDTSPALTAPPVKHILVSGAAKGIGRCLTRHFLQKGHKVFALDVDEEELKYTTEVHLKTFLEAGALSSTLCDLRSIPDIRAAAEKAAKFFDQRIDVVINNGGISTPYWKDNATMADFDTSDQWIAYVETNLTAPFHVSQACLPYMKVPANYEERKALAPDMPSPCIIHMSSFRMLRSDPNQEGYASSKAALLGLTISMAVSLSAFGLRVNMISPGRIKVAHESKQGDEEGVEWELTEDDRKKHATNRAGKPSDIAECAEWLIGAGFVTGQNITVDGGASIIR